MAVIPKRHFVSLLRTVLDEDEDVYTLRINIQFPRETALSWGHYDLTCQQETQIVDNNERYPETELSNNLRRKHIHTPIPFSRKQISKSAINAIIIIISFVLPWNAHAVNNSLEVIGWLTL